MKHTSEHLIYSNTTLVKVKLISFTVCLATLPDSNTTLVKVKFNDDVVIFIFYGQFKYNSC